MKTIIEPEVFEAAAELFFAEVPRYRPAGCCTAIALTGFEWGLYSYEDHTEFFSGLFKPTLPSGYSAPGWYMEYDIVEDDDIGTRYSYIEDSKLVLERRILALLLCAEIARDEQEVTS